MSRARKPSAQRSNGHSNHNAGGAPLGNQNALRHGLYSLRAMLNGDGLDRRTSLYRALTEKEQELISALGGDPSPQERVIIADTVKTMLFIGSLDHYLLQLKSLVRKGKVHSVLGERTRLAGHLRENLKTLGLKRVAKPVPSFDEWLAEGQDGDRQDRQPIIRRSSDSETANSSDNDGGERVDQGRGEQ